MYAERGFIDISYLPEQEFDDAARTLSLRFKIDEGIPYYVGYVAFVGCEQPEEDLARSVVCVLPGYLFRPSDLDASIEALNKLGLFRRIGEEECSVTPSEQEQGLVNIVFWLKPKRAPSR